MDETPAAVGAYMFERDHASRGLGMRLVEAGDRCATLEMTVREDMLNGFAICHGGYITLLADSAFAYACNSGNELTVASGIAVDFVAPAHRGDVLTARAVEVSHAGRTGVYDIAVTNQRGERIALLRGRSYRMKGRPVMAGARGDAPPVTAAKDGRGGPAAKEQGRPTSENRS